MNTLLQNEIGRGKPKSGGMKPFRSQGKGSPATRQGSQTITAYVDNATLALNRSQRQVPTTYPIGDDESLDLVEGEIAVSSKQNRNSIKEDRTARYVFTSLNGYNTEAPSLFPNDPMMQMLAVRNSLSLSGIIIGGTPYNKSLTKAPTVALQVAGVHSIRAGCDIPIGAFIEVRPPVPGSEPQVQSPHVPDGKILLETLPLDPHNFQTKVATILKNYANNPRNFQKYVNIKLI